MSLAAFPREARLLRPDQFRTVFANGRKYVCDGFVLIAATNNGPCARLGLALAKRRIRRAVDRNRVKRVVRESFRRHRFDVGHTDIVVLARSETFRLGNSELFDQLSRLWVRIAATPVSMSARTRGSRGTSTCEPGHLNDG